MTRKLAVLALAAVIVAAFAPAGRGDAAALALVRVPVQSDSQAAYLMSHFDETHNHGDGEIELLLWPGDRARLDALGYEYEVVTADLFARDVRAAQGPKPVVELPGPDRSDYRRLPDYEAELQQLAKDNPRLVRLITLPEKSLEGRTVYGVEIATNVRAVDGRPTFYVDGIHHAREWPAGEFPMIFAHHLVESYDKNATVRKLLGRVRVVVVPIVNPDGFDYSRESPVQVSLLALGNGFEGYWRKNRRSLTGVTVPVVQKNPDAYGVDPNRNYAFLWGDQQGGSSGIPIEQTYRGTAPFSEPETRNVRTLLLARPVTGILTNHTYQGSVLRPGGPEAPDALTLERLGGRLAATMGDYDNRESVGYPTTGTTDDWLYSAQGTLGFTIEHGRQGFHPPYAVGVGQPAKKVMAGFLFMTKVAADPRYHSVITGRVAGGAAKLTLIKKFKTPLSEGNPTGEKFITETLRLTMRTKSDGSFVWHVSPSDRPFAQRDEVYRLVVSRAGKKSTLAVDVARGEKVDLGRIVL